MRPRIRFKRGGAIATLFGWRGCYECRWGGFVGRGKTIDEAYFDWRVRYPCLLDLSGRPIDW